MDGAPERFHRTRLWRGFENDKMTAKRMASAEESRYSVIGVDA